ncbi:MAG: hypothetical protein WA639_12770 [Candidatus Acidiferrum sp.]
MKFGLVILAIALCSTSPLPSKQEQKATPISGVSCENAARALVSGEYVYGALKHVWPPSFPTSGGIAVAVEVKPAVKLLLHTDGTKFQLWTDTVDVPGGNVWDFLEKEAESCHLPPDPADAVKLLNISWESKELSKEQFDQLHRDFMTALSNYVLEVQERSAYFIRTKFLGGGVDASNYPIVYDNSWEHFEIIDWDIPIENRTDPMIRWVHELQKFAEERFHRTFGREQQSSGWLR